MVPSKISVGNKYQTSTGQILQVHSVKGESLVLQYLNRDNKGDVTTTIPQLERVLKLEVWKEITDSPINGR